MGSVVPVTAAVVSLYNPSESVLANAAILLAQTDAVVVVDDGSPEDPSDILDRLSGMGCERVRLTENSGIAAALNAGVSTALAGTLKPDFILTMDQDSSLEDGYVKALLTAAAQAEAAGIPVGMVAPGSVRGLPVRRGPVRNGVQLGGEPIQSGLLVPSSVLERLGLFDDSLFIDGVDSEFYLRCKAEGLAAVLAEGASLGHALGSTVPARVFGQAVVLGGKPLQVRTAAPWRYFYIFRNRILLARNYGLRYPWWTIKGFLADYRHLAIVTLLAPDRRPRLVNAFRGVSEGLAGRRGKRRA